jgi:hypothetical protein
VGRRCSWVSHHNKYSQSYITTRKKKKKKKKREEEEEEEKKRTLKGVVLTSFDSFSISDSWWSIESTLFPQSPRKPVWKTECMHKLGFKKKVVNLNADERNQIAVKYLHEGPLRIISRIFIFVVNKPVLHFFLLLDQFGKLVCIIYDLHIAENTL